MHTSMDIQTCECDECALRVRYWQDRQKKQKEKKAMSKGKGNVVHDSRIRLPREITSFLHCGACLREKPDGVSPEAWARLSVGVTPTGIQIWCVRHGVNVDHIHFTLEPVEGVPLTRDCGH